jgi:preprotein translocase subunit SecE
MTVTSNDEGKKWIQAIVAVVCILAGYVLISFFEKIAEWFALETMVPYYFAITQVVSVVMALATYIVVMRNARSSEFLFNVYQEVLKVVWPDSQQTWRHTFVILIVVTIFGFIFGFFDFGANYLLGLVNK